MLRGRLSSLLALVVAALVVAVPSTFAEDVANGTTLHEIPLRGGLDAALRAIGDRAPGDRGQFLVEFIRRIHDAPTAAAKSQRDALLQALIDHLEKAGDTGEEVDTLPLPLAPSLWRDTILARAGEKGTVPFSATSLVPAILKSRSAALLYYGLLSLDDPTRAWLAGQPELIGELAAKHAPALVVVGPSFRVAGGTVAVPGGDHAVPVWETLVGQPVSQPTAFLRALLTQTDGRFGFFYNAMAHLTAPQQAFALRLDAADRETRIESGRRLSTVFDRITQSWSVADRPFWKPPLDPAMLLSELATDANGAPLLPGTRALWSAALDDPDRDRGSIDDADAHEMAMGATVDFPWLCDQVFKGGSVVQRRPYEMVLFGSRVVRELTRDNAAHVLEAIRAFAVFPGLTLTLERADIIDPVVISSAVRHARQLAKIGNDERAIRALAQFQASVVLLTRAAARGTLSPDALRTLLMSLAAVPNERGAYDGRLVRWWQDTIAHHGKPPLTRQATPGRPELLLPYGDEPGSLDADVVRLLAGAHHDVHVVDWEGTRYHVDLAWAETTRLARVLGDRPRPYLSSASALVQIADGLEAAERTRSIAEQQVALAERVQQFVSWPGLDNAVAALKRTGGEGRRGHRGGALAVTLRALADDLFARGLMELVYAAALGQPTRARISASDAAARHDFGLRLFGHAGAWRLPVAGVERGRDWHVTGSLFGLDVRLADFALTRVSSRPPPMRPTLNDADRRVFTEAVSLMQGAALSDGDRDTLVGAMRHGRQRLAAARTPADLTAIADTTRLTGARRSLLHWTASHDPARLGAFLSPIELFWLGLERGLPPRLHAWGTPGEPRLGCLCLRLPEPRALQSIDGRWESGLFASTFADLNLRLTEVLTELHMPATLLPFVLSAATLDFINTAYSRGHDDRRSLVAFVQAMQPEQVEIYLALLTTDGPLVPLGDSPAPAPVGSAGKTEIAR